MQNLRARNSEAASPQTPNEVSGFQVFWSSQIGPAESSWKRVRVIIINHLSKVPNNFCIQTFLRTSTFVFSSLQWRGSPRTWTGSNCHCRRRAVLVSGGPIQSWDNSELKVGSCVCRSWFSSQRLVLRTRHRPQPTPLRSNALSSLGVLYLQRLPAPFSLHWPQRWWQWTGTCSCRLDSQKPNGSTRSLAGTAWRRISSGRGAALPLVRRSLLALRRFRECSS